MDDGVITTALRQRLKAGNLFGGKGIVDQNLHGSLLAGAGCLQTPVAHAGGAAARAIGKTTAGWLVEGRASKLYITAFGTTAQPAFTQVVSPSTLSRKF